MIKIVNGNILDAKEDIIAHQVNCMGAMGAGLAKQIKIKYPHVYDEYKNFCANTEDKSSLLGEVQLVKTNKKSLFGQRIANIFSQESYGRGKVQTDYEALENGLKKIEGLRYAKSLYNCSIALPYGIGCGLAGGDWNIVYKIIDDVFSDYEVTLYKL